MGRAFSRQRGQFWYHSSECGPACLSRLVISVCSLLFTCPVQLFHLPDHAPWVNYLNLLPPRASSSFPVTPPTSSLAWAPASGRSYQLLASGSRDGRARVWKLYPPSLEDEGATGPDGGAGIADEWRADMDAELEETKSARGGSVNSVRVEWNVTGTVLSTAGDDAKVRLWKCE